MSVIDHDYEIIRLLGEGMSGEVYEVTRNQQTWALKLLKQQPEQSDPAAWIEAFKFEFSLLKDINHPHIVSIGDFGWDRERDQLYFTQELVQGVPLNEYLTPKTDINTAQDLFRQCLQGLDAIHQANALHGDIKPSNIFVVTSTQQPAIKILDLGISHPRFQLNSGTPAYMAPEKILGDTVDVRSDLYSLAVSFYECLTASNPFRGKSSNETLRNQTALLPAAPGSLNRAITPTFNQILFRLLAKNPRDRYNNAKTVLETLSLQQGGHHAIAAPLLTERWIGRSDTVEQATQWSQNLSDFSVLFITGPAGIGKSRLLEEMKYEFELAGNSVRSYSPANKGKLQANVIYLLDDDSLQADTCLPQLQQQARAALIAVDEASLKDWQQSARQLKIKTQFLSLSPFTRDDVQQLIALSSGDQDPPQALINALLSETQGHPGRTTHLLAALCRHNQLIDEQGQWNLALFREGRVDLNKLSTSDESLEDFLYAIGTDRPAERTELILQKISQLLRNNQLKHIPEFLEQSRELIKQIEDSNQRIALRAQLLEKTAWHQILERKLSEAQSNIEAAKALLDETASSDPAIRLRLLNFQAFALNQQGKSEEAIKIFRQTHEQWQTQLTPEQQDRVVNNDLGVALMHQGDYQAATSIFEGDLNFFSRLNDPSYLIRCHYHLGECYFNMGAFTSAIKNYQAAADQSRHLEKWDLLLRAYNGLGNAENQLKQPQAAIEHYHRALDLARHLKDYLAAAAVSQNIGVIQKELGQKEQAITNLELSLKFLQQNKKTTPHSLSLKARATLELGETTRELQNFSQAKDHLNAAKNLIENESDLEGFAFYVYLALSKLALDQKDYVGFTQLYSNLLHYAISEDQKEEVAFLKNRSPVDPTQAATQNSQQQVAPVTATPFNPDPTVIKPIAGEASSDYWLRSLLEINTFLLTEKNPPALLTLILKYALSLSSAESGLILLTDESGTLSVATSQNIEVDEDLSQISRHVAEQVLREGRAIRSDNAMEDDNFKEYRSVMLLGLKSIFCVPIRAQQKVIGVLYLIHRFQTSLFNQSLEMILQAFADQAGLAIENTQLINKIEQQNIQLADQLNVAEDKIESYETLIREQGLQDRFPYHEIIARSAAMEKVFTLLDRITGTDLSTLIHGESGTGKELIARALHHNSPRKDHKFVAINCGALPANLIESELFGYKAGAFTGAQKDKPGLFETAQGGTIFLDEIGELDLQLQVKLLRALQEREIVRLGDTESIAIDVRLVSATHQNLTEAMSQGRFREDLFYRVAEIQLELPPLRDRREDIPLLVQHFAEQFSQEQQLKKPPKFQADLMKAFLAYPWPGNVRELSNRVRVACALSDGKTVGLPDLTEADRQTLLQNVPAPSQTSSPANSSAQGQQNFFTNLLHEKKSWREIETIVMAKALIYYKFDVVTAAQHLGIGQATLYNRLRKEKLKRRRTEFEALPYQFDGNTPLNQIKSDVFKQAYQLSDERPYHAARMLGVSPGMIYKWVDHGS